ncbi:hypothetical protein V2J09_011753 [Rumex salicifolius]
MGSLIKVVGGIGLVKMMNKANSISKALVIKINLIFISLLLFAYATLLLRPSSSPSYSLSFNQDNSATCSLRGCHHKMEKALKMKAVLEEAPMETKPLTKMGKPSFMNEITSSNKLGGTTIAIINMDGEDLTEWQSNGETLIHINFDRVSDLFEWKHLFPEWIDEEQDNEGWNRDMVRLQMHLVAAHMVAKKGKRDWYGRTKVVVVSPCRPMLELLRCDDLEKREGDWWYFEPEAARLDQVVALPIGSCKLSFRLWGEGVEEVYDLPSMERAAARATNKREAYATVLHSSESYICGAITLAQSLLRTNTTRDLVLLLDKSISANARAALSAAGWQIRVIKRIRNPRAEKGSYNEYNYSKFRLWQLTDYDKIIFIDSDIIALRNLDLLFQFPQITAVGNDGSIFNSGIMVLEPSNCTFRILMDRRRKIFSYNGGDQGFLNEIFSWWHRLPRRVNFLKNFWSNSSVEAGLKNGLFGSDPPRVYSIHYLGLKPWMCYRDYDCNWDLAEQHVYASDVAHERWWRLHDSMDEGLRNYCGLSEQRKIELQWDRKMARESGLKDHHWRINVTDPRRFVVVNQGQ